MGSVEYIIVGVVILFILYVWFRCCCTVVYRFYRPSCPYCVKSQAEWDKFKSDCMFKKIRPVDVNLDVPSDAQFARNFDVDGVPTIIKVSPDGNAEKYEGERTATAYMHWVEYH